MMKKFMTALALVTTVYGAAVEGGFHPFNIDVKQTTITCKTEEIADSMVTQLRAIDIKACETETAGYLKILPEEQWDGKVYSNIIIDRLGLENFEIRTYSVPQNTVLQDKINDIISVAGVKHSGSGISKPITPSRHRLCSTILDNKRYTALFSPQSETVSLLEFSYSTSDQLLPFSLRIIFKEKKDVKAYEAALRSIRLNAPFCKPSAYMMMGTSYFVNIYSLSRAGLKTIRDAVKITDLKEDDKEAFLSVMLENLEIDRAKQGLRLTNIMGDV